jgi:hypothetical protein
MFTLSMLLGMMCTTILPAFTRLFRLSAGHSNHTASNKQLGDATAPTLLSIDFTPKSVDVSSAASTITVTAHLTDNNAGADVVDAHFISWGAIKALTRICVCSQALRKTEFSKGH